MPVSASESVSAGQRPAGCPEQTRWSGTVRSVREKAVRDTGQIVTLVLIVVASSASVR